MVKSCPGSPTKTLCCSRTCLLIRISKHMYLLHEGSATPGVPHPLPGSSDGFAAVFEASGPSKLPSPLQKLSFTGNREAGHSLHGGNDVKGLRHHTLPRQFRKMQEAAKIISKLIRDLKLHHPVDYQSALNNTSQVQKISWGGIQAGTMLSLHQVGSRRPSSKSSNTTKSGHKTRSLDSSTTQDLYWL